jgi:hypothetical protein
MLETSQIMSMTRKNKWKKISTILLIPVLVICFFAGCDKPNIAFGSNFVNNNNTNIVLVDTFSADLSTVQLDSFVTAASGTMLIGSYKDPYFGDITSRSFVQVGVPTIPPLTFQSTFDSISLIMRINKTFYGDTTITQRYYVNQLDEIISLPKQPATQTTFYNTSTFAFDPTPLGFADVTIKPTAGITTSIVIKDSVKIRLPDSLGSRLLDMMYHKSDTITNLTTFINYFKGLTISADNSGKGVVYGFKDSIILRLYYHQPVGGSFAFLQVDFPISNRAFQFNQVSYDRSGTPLTAFNGVPRPNPRIPPEVPAVSTNHAAYVQPITGLQAKVRFPSIFSLTQQADFIGIIKATLILKPKQGSYSPTMPLPPQLILSQTDQNNELGGSLALGAAVQNGNLVTDYITGQNTAYTYDVTNYLKVEAPVTGINLSGLMISVPAPANNTTFNRVVLGDKTNNVFNAKLLIYYVALPH